MTRIPLKTGQAVEFTTTLQCKIINRYDSTWPPSMRILAGQYGVVDMSYTVLPGDIPVELTGVSLGDIQPTSDPDLSCASIVVSVREGAIAAFQLEYDHNGYVVKKVYRNDEEHIKDES